MSTLDLPDVVRAFEESRELLEQLHERLQAVVLAEDTATRAADSLDSAAQQVTDFVTQARELTASLNDAHGAVLQALHAAQSFIEGTELSTLQADVEALKEGLSSTRSEMLAHLAEVGAAIRASGEAHAEIEKLKSALSPRKLSKLGYDV